MPDSKLLEEAKKLRDHICTCSNLGDLVKEPLNLIYEGGDWEIRSPNAIGCLSFGKTPEEALRHWRKNRSIWGTLQLLRRKE